MWFLVSFPVFFLLFGLLFPEIVISFLEKLQINLRRYVFEQEKEKAARLLWWQLKSAVRENKLTEKDVQEFWEANALQMISDRAQLRIRDIFDEENLN